MTTTPGFSKKTVDVADRSFTIQILKFDNGNFVSVSEGTQKIGSMMVSIGTGHVPTTATVIPAKSESLFLKLTAERISTTMKGICVITANVEKELDSNSAKTLMSEIMEMARNV